MPTENKRSLIPSRYEAPLWKVYQILYFTALVCVIGVRYYDKSAFPAHKQALPFAIYEFFSFSASLLLPLLVAINLACILLSLMNVTAGKFRWEKSEMLTALLCCAAMAIPYLLFDYEHPYYFAVFILASHKIDYRRLIRVFLLASAVMFAALLICCFAGVIPDNIAYRTSGIERHAFGFNYATFPPTHLFFLSVCLAWLREERITYAEIGAIGALAAFSLVFCHARTSFISLALLCAFLLWTKLRARKTDGHYEMTKPLKTLSALSHPLTALGMIVLSVFYCDKSAVFSALNRLTNNRLTLGHTGFFRYGVTPLGQAVTLNTEPPDEYFMLDCAYIDVLIRYGALAFFVVMFILVYIGCRKCKAGRYVQLGVLAIVAVKLSMEYHILALDHTPILLYLLAFDPDEGKGFDLFSAFPRRKQKEKTSA